MRNVKIYTFIGLLGLIFLIFRGWFFNSIITGGDFWYRFPSMYHQYDSAWYAWDALRGNGLGLSSTLYQAINFDFGLPIFLFGDILHLPWSVISKLCFFFPFIFLSVFSSYYFHKKVFQKTTLWVISAIIFSLNTYTLTVVGGGQIVIGLTYALSPILLALLIEGISTPSKNINKAFLAGLILGIELVLDLRYAYILIIGVLLYCLVFIFYYFSKYKINFFIKSIFFGLIVPLFISYLLNGFWSVPLLMNRKNPLNELGDAYNALGSVKFFSFATFENSISLLHPNWPENLFGKVYFMRPEFLILPLIAFMSLFAVRRIKEKTSEKLYILYFILLGLLGAFLSKGAQEPFGGVYLWMFQKIPGMVMFRDPTKFYTLTAISFSILIPFVFYRVQIRLKKHKNIVILIPILFIFFWVFSIRQAVFQDLSGTFRNNTLPKEYIKLEKTLREDKDFSRVLWIPQVQRFGYYSQTHPAIPANEYLKTYTFTDLPVKIKSGSTEQLLNETGVKYVIVAYDSMGEIYLDDRKYSEKIYKKLLDDIQKIPYLERDKSFKQIGFFTTKTFRKHFWSDSPELSIDFQQITPVEYKVTVGNAKKGDILVFSETYDPRWKMIERSSGTELYSTKYENNLNSFALPRNGVYSIYIYYNPQIYVNLGIAVSIITLTIIVGYYCVTILKRK